MNNKYTFLKIISILGMIGTICLGLLLPYLSNLYFNVFNVKIGLNVKIFVWVTLVPLFILVFEFFKISSLLQNEQGLNNKAISRIVHIKRCLLSELILYIFAIVFFKELIALIIFLGIVIIYIFTILVQELLKQAIVFYEDSSLSI